MSTDGLSSEFLGGVDEFLAKLKGQYSAESIELIKKAYDYSEKAHEGQIRRSGEPYISHPLGVASILADLKLDSASVITGLLHDTVEDTDVTLGDLTREFGDI